MTYANAKNFFQNTALSNLFFAAGGSLLTYLPLRGVHPWCTSNNGTRLARRMLFVELRTRHKPWRAEWKGRLLLPTLLLFFLSIYIGTQLLPFPPVCILHLSLLLLLQSSRCQTTTLTLFLFRDTVNSVITLPQQYET